MRAIKHEPSPASGAAGIGAALPLLDPGATESQGSHTCMDQIAGMKEKFCFLLPIFLAFHPLPLLSAEVGAHEVLFPRGMWEGGVWPSSSWLWEGWQGGFSPSLLEN